MRLFAALPLSDPAVERLMSLRLRLSAPRDGLRWSEPEQWHFTLQFFGEVNEAVAGCLASELAKVTAAAPLLTLERLDLFAAKGILFAAIEESPSLNALYAEVLACGRACGIEPESRPFRPHVTLARSKGKAGHKALQQLSKPTLPSMGTPIRWFAPECLLLESVLRPQGSQYLLRSRALLESQSEVGGSGRYE